MSRIPLSLVSDKSTVLIFCALAASLVLNIFTINRLVEPNAIDTKTYRYAGDDHPRELPLKLDAVGLTFNDSEYYSISYDFLAPAYWDALSYFPKSGGLVRMGPEGREYGVAMFRQMHCVKVLRWALLYGPDGQSELCMNLLRQAVLCASDISIDALNVEVDGTLQGTNGIGTTHVCRDWTQVYAFIEENQQSDDWALVNKARVPTDWRAMYY